MSGMQKIQVKFVYEGNPVKVKVTGPRGDPATPCSSKIMTATAVTTSPFQLFREAARMGRLTGHSDDIRASLCRLKQGNPGSR